jgi:hypothetical protein
MLLIIGGLIVAVGMIILAWNLLMLIGSIAGFIVTGSVAAILWLILKKQPLLLGIFISLILSVIAVVGGAFKLHHGHDPKFLQQVCAYSLIAVMCIAALAETWIWKERIGRWKKKGRSEQGWEPVQTEVYGGTAALEMSVEEAARFAAYVAHCGGNVTVNVVDDEPAMKNITPERKRLK